MKRTFYTVLALLCVAFAVASCGGGMTVTIGRSITSANYNENDENSHAQNVASPNASNFVREVGKLSPTAGADEPTVSLTGTDSDIAYVAKATGLLSINAGRDLIQDKPVSTDAALAKQLGNTDGTGQAQKDSDSDSKGGNDTANPTIDVTP